MWCPKPRGCRRVGLQEGWAAKRSYCDCSCHQRERSSDGVERPCGQRLEEFRRVAACASPRRVRRGVEATSDLHGGQEGAWAAKIKGRYCYLNLSTDRCIFSGRLRGSRKIRSIDDVFGFTWVQWRRFKERERAMLVGLEGAVGVGALALARGGMGGRY